MMNFEELPEFKKDLKRLAKKFRSLDEDLAEFKKIVSSVPEGNSRYFAPLKRVNSVVVIKTRLFCRYLKGRSLRIVYAYNQAESRIVFIELYFKGDKENEDTKRVDRYCAMLGKKGA